MQASAATTRRGKGLTRMVVAAAAVELVEAEGIKALSMRRLAARLGVEAMSLYGHVTNRHDLLMAMNDWVLAGVASHSQASANPLEDALSFVRELRDALVSHPNTARLFAMNMSLQDSFATQVLTARALEILLRMDLDPPTAARVFGQCLSFVIGAVLLEVAIVQTGGPGAEVYDPALAFEEGVMALLSATGNR